MWASQSRNVKGLVFICLCHSQKQKPFGVCHLPKVVQFLCLFLNFMYPGKVCGALVLLFSAALCFTFAHIHTWELPHLLVLATYQEWIKSWDQALGTWPLIIYLSSFSNGRSLQWSKCLQLTMQKKKCLVQVFQSQINHLSCAVISVWCFSFNFTGNLKLYSLQ